MSATATKPRDSTIEKLATAIAAYKPANLYTDDKARLQWYALCSAAANAVFHKNTADAAVNVGRFFDLCGVPD
jgi:hypothetical protein